MTTLTPKQEEIAVRAYHLYIEGGCQHGRDLEYWFQAEKELGGHFFTPPSAKEPAPKAARKPAAKKVATTPARKATSKKAGDAPTKKAAKKKA